VALLLVIYLVRVVRWGILLDPAARIPFAQLNAASGVGFLAQLILPLRLGEVARPYLVAQATGIRISEALSSVVVERVADGVFTALLFVVALAAAPEGTPGLPPLRAIGTAVLLGFATTGLFLVLAHRNRGAAVSATRRLVGAFSPRAAVRLSGMLDGFLHGLRHVPRWRGALLFVALTALYWGLTAACMKVLACGFGFDLSALAACIVLGIVVVGIMLPAAPGMVGTFQAAVVLGLSIFASREAVDTNGIAFANVLWLTQLAVQVAIGAYFLLARHIPLDSVVRARSDPRESDPEACEPMRTEEPSYAARLVEIEGVWWKRLLDVQRPYRRHLRRLRLGFALDLGCGIGRNLAGLGPGAGVGVDHNARAVEIARRRGLLAFTPDDFLASPYAVPGRFDSLLLSHVLEHMEPREADALLRTYLGFLRPGGRVVMIAPQEAGFRSDPTHVTFLDFACLERLARGVGLEPVARYSFPFPRPAGRLFRYNEFVAIARKPEEPPRPGRE
jgi:uncharacterized protein (TIRG00374 family)